MIYIGIILYLIIAFIFLLGALAHDTREDKQMPLVAFACLFWPVVILIDLVRG